MNINIFNTNLSYVFIAVKVEMLFQRISHRPELRTFDRLSARCRSWEHHG